MIFNFQNHQDAAEFIASFLKGSVNRYKKVGLVARTTVGLTKVLDGIRPGVPEATYSFVGPPSVETPNVDIVGMVAGDGKAVREMEFHWIVFVDRDGLPPAAVETILAGRQ